MVLRIEVFQNPLILILRSESFRPVTWNQPLAATGWAVNPSAGWKLGFGFSRLNAALPIAWRIILGTLRRIRITPMYFSHFHGHLEGVPQPDPERGLTITMVIYHLLTGMILEVVGKTSQGFVHTLSCIVGISWFGEKLWYQVIQFVTI